MRRAARVLLTALAVLMVTGSVGGIAQGDADGELLYSSTNPEEFNTYARVVRLEHAGPDNGRLLATFEHDYHDGSPAELIIRSSSDDGRTWDTLSTIADPLTGPGHPVSRMWQPFIYEFPRTLGDFPAGTLLLAANMVPADGARTQFYTWRSTDHGHSWQPVGLLQEGGTFGKGIWEPFLTMDRRGRLLAYFADERRAPEHSQMIVHVASEDGGESWGPVIEDVRSAVSADRPGMPSVTRMGPNGEFVLSYEVCGRPHCEVRYKVSPDGDRWRPTELGQRVVTSDGRYPGHSPYVTWLPETDELVLAGQRVFSAVGHEPTGEDYRTLFVNDNRGRGEWSWAPSPWTVSPVSTDCNANYSPHLMPGPTPGTVRYTAPTSTGDAGPCAERTGVARVGVLPRQAQFDDVGDAGWINYGGCWEVSGGVYTVTCGGELGAKAVTGSTGWTDYRFTTDLQITSESGDAGVLARLTDPGVGSDSHAAYTAFIDVATDQLILARQHYAYAPLATVPVSGGVDPSTWYRLSLTVEGDRLEASVQPTGGGGVTTLRYTDPHNSFQHGMVGLRTHAGTAAFRSVSVEAL